MVVKAEYIWIDGSKPTQKLRCKTKILPDLEEVVELSELPVWGFDGSSTEQAEGHASDCALKPVNFFVDPIRGYPHVLVMTEVCDPLTMAPHSSNTRAPCVDMADKHVAEECWFGIEQEYTFFDGIKPLGWPDNGFPAPQGGYYCGVGADEVYGREIVEDHMDACLEAGLTFSGINAEVMPGQWEFQIGPVGAPDAGDELWIARWLLYRIAEDYGVSATLDAKPIKGDWNGAGAHTNFSTKAMREDGGMAVIEEACEKLGKRALIHVKNYGADIESRLTGAHETQRWDEFSWGVSDRGASIRIPWNVAIDKKGYLEDRRPNANADPYVICKLMIESICDL
ncbi:MAG TPA: glutamine synthetase [Candidatus Poseidoniales archaeon]|jgi:glutamine synthetase|nr:MAG: glutamine synthetase [Euryarchaeota archaeon]HIF16790.1 glutamine synthetase [Candidatus Poseidoniales archaeon]